MTPPDLRLRQLFAQAQAVLITTNTNELMEAYAISNSHVIQAIERLAGDEQSAEEKVIELATEAMKQAAISEELAARGYFITFTRSQSKTKH